MAAAGIKLGLAAFAGLLLLFPTFNSLNQVVVEDVDPPVTVENPPPNVPPRRGDRPIDVDPDPSQGERAECPPPKYEVVYEWEWQSPPALLSTGDRGTFEVLPGSAGLLHGGNLSGFVGSVRILLLDPEQSGREVFRYDSRSPTAGGVGNEQFGPRMEPGAVPGPWEVVIELEPLSSGRLDFKVAQVWPCGGAGMPPPGAASREARDA